MSTEPRFHIVNGRKLRDFRRRLGWSQSELARRSGYSERVIRKAESGGSLKLDTLQVLAEALSVNGTEVKPVDLTIDEMSITKDFVQKYDSMGQEMLASCSHYLSDDFELHCPADKQSLPFGGVWKGILGLQEFLDSFFKLFERKANSIEPVYMTGEDRVVARFEEKVSFRDIDLPPYWVNMHFHFRDGLISRIDDEFDVHGVSKSLDDVLIKLSLKSSDGTRLQEPESGYW